MIEGIDTGSILRGQRNVERAVQPTFAADPKIRLAGDAEARGGRIIVGLAHLHDELVSERLQGLAIKRLGVFVIRHREANVIEHCAPPGRIGGTPRRHPGVWKSAYYAEWRVPPACGQKTPAPPPGGKPPDRRRPPPPPPRPAPPPPWSA